MLQSWKTQKSRISRDDRAHGDIVVRFRDPTKEQQGYYDLGFVKDRTGEKYEAVAVGLSSR